MPLDVESRVRDESRAGGGHRHLLRLDTEHLRHPAGHIEVDDRPALDRGTNHQPRIGVHRERVPDGGQQRRVVPAVGVRVRVRQRNVVLISPLLHRVELAFAPHELAADRSVVTTISDAVARRYDIVETERVGQWLDEVIWRRRRENHSPPGSVVLFDDRRRERLHRVDEHVRCSLPCCLRGLARPAPREAGGDARELHRRPALPEHVEVPVEERFAGDRPIRHQAHRLQRFADDGPARPAQQRPIEIEERGFPTHGANATPRKMELAAGPMVRRPHSARAGSWGGQDRPASDVGSSSQRSLDLSNSSRG